MVQPETSRPASVTRPTIRPDVSVIVVSWNVRSLLVGCLEALLSPSVAGGLSLETIVVDNASSDGSAEAARAFPGVRVIEAGRNLGYGPGNNFGMQAAMGRHLLILNPDTIPQPHSVARLVEFAERTPRAGIVAPRLLNPDGSVQRSAFRFPTLLMALLDLFPLPRIVPGRFRKRLYESRLNGRFPGEPDRREPFRIDHPLGACMLLRREAFEEVGGFDPRIFMYAEEIDLALRYAAAGWECWQVPAAEVVHLGGQSTRQMPDRMFVELWRSRLYLYSRHYSRQAQTGLRALLALSQGVALGSARAGRLLHPGPEVTARERKARYLLRLALRGGGRK